jgi:2,5-furandicarboxylate decarboxylase 1
MSSDGLRGLIDESRKAGDLDARDMKNRRAEAGKAATLSNMFDQSIRGFLQTLERKGELVRFDKQVDPDANMAAIEWRACNELGKASLFTDIKGHPGWQACSQILSDRGKWALALNLAEDELLPGLNRKLASRIAPVVEDTPSAPCQEVVLTGEEASLLDIPAMLASEHDGGKFLASGMAIVKDPETGIRNVSIHRQHIYDAHHTGFVMLPRQARRIYDMYKAQGRHMPAAVVIGAHPAIMFSSGFVTGYGDDEFSIAGALLGDPVRMVKCKTIDMEVPADAEIVIEGEVLCDEIRPEGPYGEIPGTYAKAGTAEVFRVKAITRRRSAIYYALHCGAPTTETQATTGLAIELATWDHLQKVEGGLDLLDVRCHPAGAMMMLVIKLRPRVAGQAKTALMAALSGPFLHPKLAIAVDDDIDANDLRQVMWSMTTRVHAEKDIDMIGNTRVFALDNVSPFVGGNPFHRIGAKWLIDATKPPPSDPEGRERFARAMPRNFDAVKLEDFLPEEMFR